MADKSTGARIVGKVAIKAIPETSDFKTDLKEKLKAIEETTSFTIAVDKAKISKVALRESLQQQLDELRNLKVDVDANIIISEVTKWTFKKDVRDLVKYANGQSANINVAAATAGATAQLRWLSRARFVEIIPTISQAAYTKVATQLAALSGLRATNELFTDVKDFIENLDKNLPNLTLWTTGITNLVSALLGLTAGLVGLGQGLVAISPALLVIPGLFINALASLTVLIVALRDARNQLSPLSAGMRELAQIMRDGFWKNARQPIIDLVNNLMPQLRQAFANVSDGVGFFTGQLAKAFDAELAGGRLLSIFNNIDQGWRILATGAAGFAGAIVNLSEIAARYTPRLAAWFVRQANAFDAWLTQISTDGRLDAWMEGAINAMYDLWRATTNLGGVFKNLWDAANKAGYEGLNGIADVLQRWNEITAGDTFQRGMTALFEGARMGLQAIGRGISDVGQAFARQTDTVKNFIQTSGEIFGALLSGIGQLISSETVAAGIDSFINGIKEGLDNFLSYIPRVEGALSSILDFAGTLATQIGDVVGSAISGLSDLLTPALNALKDNVLKPISTGLTELFNDPELQAGLQKLGGSLGEIVGKLGDLIDNKIPGLQARIKEVVPIIQWFADTFNFLLDVEKNLEGLVGSLFSPDLFSGPGNYAKKAFPDLWSWFSGGADTKDQGAGGMGGGMSRGGMAGLLEEEKAKAVPVWQSIFIEMSRIAQESWAAISLVFTEKAAAVSASVSAFVESVKTFFGSMPEKIGTAVSALWTRISDSFKTGGENAASYVSQLITNVKAFFANPGSFLYSVGRDILAGLVAGMEEKFPGLVTFLKKLVDMIPDAIKKALGINSPSRVMRYEIGRWIPAGIELGIQDGLPELEQTVNQMISIPSITPDSVAASYNTNTNTSTSNTTIQVFPQSVDVAGIALEVSRYLKFGV